MLTGKDIKYMIHDDNNVKGFFNEYRWMSNYHEATVVYDGMTYPSSECAYQAAKTLNLEKRKAFQLMKPNESKKAGKAMTDIRPDWDQVRYDVMAAIVFDKFWRNKDLRRKLSETHLKYLEETNHWKDKYWGVCDGEGQNNLGEILMRVRDFWKE